MSHETVNVTFAFPPRVYGVLPAGVAEVVGAALVTSKHVVGVGVWDCMLLVGGVLMAVAGMLMVVRVVVPAAASLVLRVLQGWSTTTNASHTAQTRRGPRWAVVLGGGRRVGRALAAQLCSHRETRHMHILLCDTDPEEVRLAAAELQHATAAPEGSIVACTLDLSSAEMWIELDMVLRRVGAVTGGRVCPFFPKNNNNQTTTGCREDISPRDAHNRPTRARCLPRGLRCVCGGPIVGRVSWRHASRGGVEVSAWQCGGGVPGVAVCDGCVVCVL